MKQFSKKWINGRIQETFTLKYGFRSNEDHNKIISWERCSSESAFVSSVQKKFIKKWFDSKDILFKWFWEFGRRKFTIKWFTEDNIYEKVIIRAQYGKND